MTSINGVRCCKAWKRIPHQLNAPIIFNSSSSGTSLYDSTCSPGANNLAAHEGLCALVKRFAAEGRRVAAICAAPGILGGLGLLDGRLATCHPGWEDKLGGAEYTRQGVVTDGNITTGRGVGFAIDFGLELVRLLKGEEFADDLRRRIQYPGC